MGMLRIKPLTLREPVTSGNERWFRVNVQQAKVCAVQISWQDGTFACDAPVFYSSIWDDPPIPADGTAAPNLEYWTLEGDVEGTAVSASASGSQTYHIGNNGSRFLLVKINPTATDATATLTVQAHGKE